MYALAEKVDQEKNQQGLLAKARDDGFREGLTAAVELVNNFQYALEASQEMPRSRGKIQSELDAIANGFRVTSRRAFKIINKYGLTAYRPAPGDPFDPSTMDAIDAIETTHTDQINTVSRCISLGYMLRNKVFHYATVSIFVPST